MKISYCEYWKSLYKGRIIRKCSWVYDSLPAIVSILNRADLHPMSIINLNWSCQRRAQFRGRESFLVRMKILITWSDCRSVDANRAARREQRCACKIKRSHGKSSILFRRFDSSKWLQPSNRWPSIGWTTSRKTMASKSLAREGGNPSHCSRHFAASTRIDFTDLLGADYGQNKRW